MLVLTIAIGPNGPNDVQIISNMPPGDTAALGRLAQVLGAVQSQMLADLVSLTGKHETAPEDALEQS